MPRPAARRLVLALLFALLGAGALVAMSGQPSADPSRYAGRPLAEALRLLQRQGLAIVYTSRLVTPEMRVGREPRAAAPRQALDELLAPHGLAAREDPSGLLVVVRAPTVAEPEPAGAAVPPSPPMPILREQIEVRPSRLPLLGPPDPSSIAFDRAEIERLPHLAGDLFRAASLLPGTAANDVSAQLAVRGGRPDELAVRLDGQELYGAFHLTDYEGALSVVPARLLAGATLTTGALPVNVGDRMGGVLDLRTLPSHAGREGVVALSVLDALASTAAGFADGSGGWRLSGRRGSLLFARRAIGSERPHFWDLLGTVDRTTRSGTFAAHLLATGDTLRVDRKDEGDFEKLDNRYRNRYGWVRHQAGNEVVLAQTLASWAQLTHERGTDVAEEKGEFALRDERRTRVLALEQSWSVPRGNHSLEWGWEARRYDTAFHYAQRRRPAILVEGPFVPPRPATRRFDGSVRSDHLALWTRDVRSWSDRLTADLGLRYDHHDHPHEALVSPRSALALRVAERGVLRAAWGRFAQRQRPYELAVGDGETRLAEAEISDQWVVGYETTPRQPHLALSGLRLELYSRRIDDPRQRFESLLEPVNFFPEIEPGRARLAPESSRARGAELLLRGRAGEHGSWWLAYSWSRSEDRLAAEGVARRWVPRATDQPHSLTVVASRRLARQWQLDLAWRWHTGWPTTPVTPLPPEPEPPDDPDDPDEPDEPDDVHGVAPADKPPARAVFGELQSRRFPPYHRLDLRASRSWSSRRGAFTFFLDVQNAYARRNLAGFDVVVEDDGSAGLDRESWPGIVPSLGIVWRFGE